MIAPRIVLSLGRIATADGAINVDLRHKAIWYKGLCVLCWKVADQSRLQTRFLAVTCLLYAYPNMVSHKEMIEFICGDDVDGGPDTIRDSISATLCNARKQLAFLGFKLFTEWGRGYRLELLPQRQRIAA
jgi:hypothetical protein